MGVSDVAVRYLSDKSACASVYFSTIVPEERDEIVDTHNPQAICDRGCNATFIYPGVIPFLCQGSPCRMIGSLRGYTLPYHSVWIFRVPNGLGGGHWLQAYDFTKVSIILAFHFSWAGFLAI
jgi:hypothetical protein